MTDEHANPEEEPRPADEQSGQAEGETTTESSGEADPLKKVAEAMSTAASAVQEGASDARAKAQTVAGQ